MGGRPTTTPPSGYDVSNSALSYFSSEAGAVAGVPSAPAPDPGCCGDEGYCERFIRFARLKNFAMLLVCAVYAALGGALFHLIEGPAEQASHTSRLRKTLDDRINLTQFIADIYMVGWFCNMKISFQRKS